MKEYTNKTSAKKDGYGGADTVKKKDITIIKDKRGDIHKRPRIITCCRVDEKEYITPTSINNNGELIPWRNITAKIPLKLTRELEISIIGIVIMCDTEE